MVVEILRQILLKSIQRLQLVPGHGAGVRNSHST